MKFLGSTFLAAVALTFAGASAGWAQSGTLRVSTQDGLAYLPFIIMEQEKLVEQLARDKGLGDVKVEWTRLASSATANDALLSGNLDIATGGVPGFVILWERTRSNLAVKSIGAWASVPSYLMVKNKDIATPRDFTDKDRIAVPAVKTSNQAIFLQMLSEQLYGKDVFDRFDTMTVSLAHLDGMNAMLNPASEVTAHFAIEPFASRERESGARMLLTSYDVLGGPATSSLMWSTTKFYEENEALVDVFLEAFSVAADRIAADKGAAAQTYIAATGSRQSIDDISVTLNDPLMEFGLTPQNVMPVADFLSRTGIIKSRPADWKEMFFPVAHDGGGS